MLPPHINFTVTSRAFLSVTMNIVTATIIGFVEKLALEQLGTTNKTRETEASFKKEDFLLERGQRRKGRRGGTAPAVPQARAARGTLRIQAASQQQHRMREPRQPSPSVAFQHQAAFLQEEPAALSDPRLAREADALRGGHRRGLRTVDS